MPDRLSAFCFLLPVVGVLLGERVAATWIWDLANGFGFAAFAGLVYLSAQGKQRKLQLKHKHFGYAVTALLAMHILTLLLSDQIVIEYVLPGAPLYMWTGTFATLLLIFIVLSALPSARHRSFTGQNGFRAWHKPLSWLLIACAVYHIIGSGFYLRTPLQWIALLLLFAPLLLPAKYANGTALKAYSPLSFVALGVASAVLLSFALNWSIQ